MLIEHRQPARSAHDLGTRHCARARPARALRRSNASIDALASERSGQGFKSAARSRFARSRASAPLVSSRHRATPSDSACSRTPEVLAFRRTPDLRPSAILCACSSRVRGSRPATAAAPRRRLCASAISSASRSSARPNAAVGRRRCRRAHRHAYNRGCARARRRHRPPAIGRIADARSADRTVGSSVSGREVIRMNTDAGSGSSSVLSNAFCAARTSAHRPARYRDAPASLERAGHRLVDRRTHLFDLDGSVSPGSIVCTSGWVPRAMRRQAEHSPQASQAD